MFKAPYSSPSLILDIYVDLFSFIFSFTLMTCKSTSNQIQFCFTSLVEKMYEWSNDYTNWHTNSSILGISNTLASNAKLLKFS